MCGRYFIASDDDGELELESAIEDAAVISENRDICPGMEAPALVLEGDKLSSRHMRWGFERPAGGLIINARVETISERPTFRALAATQRCALPAAGYYEWRRSDRQKYSIALADRRRFWLAGLYRLGGAGVEFVVLTQTPVPTIERVHNRMPLLLPGPDFARRWLAGETPLFRDDSRIRLMSEGPEQLSMALFT